jgi:hypothetical protein
VSSACVQVSEGISFEGSAEVPSGGGSIVEAECYFEGTGEYPVKRAVQGGEAVLSAVTVAATHVFSEPGTYFPVL